MNKRFLILVGVVLCMILNLVMPIKVNALEDGLVEETQIGETTVPSSLSDSEESVPKDEEEKPKEEPAGEVITRGEVTTPGEETEGETPTTETVTDSEGEEVKPMLGAAPTSGETNEVEPTSDDVVLTNDGEPKEEPEIEYGEVFDIQKVKVIITKVDEEGNPLAGAKLQILDPNGKLIDEWVSDGKAHEIELTDGTYTLHEVEAPEGYDLAEDQEIPVKVEIKPTTANVDFSETPCPHYEGTPLYYVTIAGKKHEVYCINQDWETPDGVSQYDGAILDSTDIRDYTKQTVFVDAQKNKAKKDISDQTLEDDELYDKILDIIYHRNKATTMFTDLTEAEIRYVTESALKNYTNAGLTRVQGDLTTRMPEGYEERSHYVSGSYTYYLQMWYRDFVYTPNVALGKDIYETKLGQGDAFGTLARHWTDSKGHNGKNDQDVRDKVARFYDLYQYLISDTDHHPEEMHLYIYSASNTATDTSVYDFDSGAYQNLLGVTGYFEDVEQQKQEVEMVNKYSTKTTSVKVTKVWADDNDEEKKRPESVTVTLLANGKEYDTIVLSEENEWKHEFTDLLVYSLGEKIEYTVREENVPEGYVASYEEDGEYGFIIHNVKGQGDHEPPPDNPQTGDNIVLYLITLLISIIGLVSSKRYLKENN